MDSQNRENPSNFLVGTVGISFRGIDSERQALLLHNTMYNRLNLKLRPPERIPDTIAKLGIGEILITVTLAPIFHYAITSIIKVIRDFIRDRKSKSCEGQIIIKVDDNDLGKRFPFSTQQTNLEEFFEIIDVYVKNLQKKHVSDLIEMRIKIDEKMKELFKTETTILDIKAVLPEKMLEEEMDLAAVTYSLEQYHKFVKDRAEQNQGTVLSITGCEVMASFVSADNAVDCALDILSDKNGFNANKNKLNRPFRFRIGINTGLVLVDDKETKVFCRGPLDLAREVQRNAEPGMFLVSGHTLCKLGNKDLFTKSKCIKPDDIWTYTQFSY